MAPRKYKWKRLTPKQRKEILTRDGFRCTICGAGKPRRLHVHHIAGHRISKPNAKRNLTTLCATCHELLGLLAGHAKALVYDKGLLNKAIKLALRHIKAMDDWRKQGC